MVQIRPATETDAAAMAEVHHSAVHGIATEHYDHAVLDAWSPAVIPERVALFRDTVKRGEEMMIVAELDGRVMGFGSIVPAANELRAVYVAAAHASHGVGSSILAELERLARAAGCPELHMDASLNAEVFYRNRGYVPTGRADHGTRSGGSMPAVQMRKLLTR